MALRATHDETALPAATPPAISTAISTAADRAPSRRIASGVYVAAGHVFVALGVIGIFVPLMPTTVFLLLAAAAYARGSLRFYHWLIWHPRLGPYVRDFRERGGMPLRAKVTAITLLVVVLGSSTLLLVHSVPVQLALAALGLAIIAYLLRIPTL